MVSVGARLKEGCLHPKCRNLEVLVVSRGLWAEAAAAPAEVSVPSAPFPGVSRFLRGAGELVYACSGTHR